MLPRIIGIIGKRRSGKDTIANILNKHYGYENKKFSTPLKEAIKPLFGLTDEQVNSSLKDDIDKRWGISPRELLQFFGTEIMQEYINNIINVNRGFFVKRLFIDDDLKTQFVISDVRFKHEAYAIHEKGGVLLKVVRPNVVINNITDTHLSETELDEIVPDILVSNNGTIEQLEKKVKIALNL